jgi:hypothetical protein
MSQSAIYCDFWPVTGWFKLYETAAQKRLTIPVQSNSPGELSLRVHTGLMLKAFEWVLPV